MAAALHQTLLLCLLNQTPLVSYIASYLVGIWETLEQFLVTNTTTCIFFFLFSFSFVHFPHPALAMVCSLRSQLLITILPGWLNSRAEKWLSSSVTCIAVITTQRFPACLCTWQWCSGRDASRQTSLTSLSAALSESQPNAGHLPVFFSTKRDPQ